MRWALRGNLSGIARCEMRNTLGAYDNVYDNTLSTGSGSAMGGISEALLYGDR